MEDSSTKSWNDIADDWVAHADTNDYKNLFIMPHTLELLPNVKGKRLLDLGCGEGSYSRELAKMGALVTAIDGSTRLTEIAQERAKNESLDIKCLPRNANNLEGLDNSSFDYVLAAMSLMDVEDYEGAIAEVHRVLRAGGQLIMSILHPSYSGRKCRWWHDGDTRYHHYVVDDYFEKKAWEEYITDRFRKPVIFRRMPLQDYINPLITRHFKLLLFKEPTPTKEQISKSTRLARLLRIPLFLIMIWEKE